MITDLLAPSTLVVTVTVLCITLWVAAPLDPSYTGLIGIGLIGALISPEYALAGFRTPATWLIAFGLIVGQATKDSGLARTTSMWFLDAVLSREDLDDPTAAYRRLVVVLSGIGLGLVVVVPSSIVRVLILAPVASEVGSMFESDEARLGLFLAPLLTTFFASTSILTAGLQNVIAVGVLESVQSRSIAWSDWALTMFPVSGIGRAILVAGTVYYLFRPAASKRTITLPSERRTSLDGSERRMALYLIAGVVFWATDFVHGLHPLYGALLVAILALAPRVGVMTFGDVEEIDFSIVFFFGAIFAIATALTETGLTRRAAMEILQRIPTDVPLAFVLLAVFFLLVILQFAMESIAAVSVLTPVLIDYATASGYPIEPLLMSESLAAVTVFFPYQSAVLVTIVGLRDVDTRRLIVTMAWCNVVAVIGLVPFQLGLIILLS